MKIKKAFNTVIDLEGKKSTRPLTYLDSTATALPDGKTIQEINTFLKQGYANTHTIGHHRGRTSTEAVNLARHSVGELVNYDPNQDVVIFKGTGATEPLNYLAQVLFPKGLRLVNNPDLSSRAKNEILAALPSDKRLIAEEMMRKPIVITTEMEHHANQLPWFDNSNVKIVPVDRRTGELDLEVMEELLEEHKGKVRLVSVSGASNITGIVNPVYEIAKMTHLSGAEICVDAAQLAPHYAIDKRRSKSETLDYIVMSPHKFGVPFGPGVLVANTSLFANRRNLVSLGGGMVSIVTAFPAGFTPIDDIAAGEEPGTPNVPGIVAVGLTASYLKSAMPGLMAHEKKLTRSLLTELGKFEREGDIRIIGTKDPERRVGVVSFSVKDVPHPVVTAYLNDHWNIATRNGCFCAHPYMIRMEAATDSTINRVRGGDRSDIPGYVRISFGEHNTDEDISTVMEALTELVGNKQKINAFYEIDRDGNAVRKDGFRTHSNWSYHEAKGRLESSRLEM